MALTKRRIEKLTKVGLHADERTLYLKVSKGGGVRDFAQCPDVEG